MIVDDEPLNVRTVRRHLTVAGFESFVTTSDSAEALVMLGLSDPDVVLLDIMMPDPGGLEVLSQIRSVAKFEQLPVIILTAVDDSDVKHKALNLGATDFLTKPVDPNELVPRVRNSLMLKAYHDQLRDHALRLESEVQRTKELEESRLAIIQAWCAAEYRDNQTGRHALRVGRYAGTIARQVGLPEESARLIELAAPLHDVGKIGVPDAIFRTGQAQHRKRSTSCRSTAVTAKGSSSRCRGTKCKPIVPIPKSVASSWSVPAPLLDLAASIALTHHERWDGTGYPLGLAGENIPIEGRITAVADTFDGVSSKNELQACLSLGAVHRDSGRGPRTQFDPQVLNAFQECRQKIVHIQLSYAETS